MLTYAKEEIAKSDDSTKKPIENTDNTPEQQIENTQPEEEETPEQLGERLAKQAMQNWKKEFYRTYIQPYLSLPTTLPFLG